MQNQCERNMASSGAGRDERWILAGATALVTGRSKGIGRAIVEELVGFGSTVHTCARSEAELSRCQEELTAKGLAVSFSVCDVSVRTDREELVSRVRELFGGKLNILVSLIISCHHDFQRSNGICKIRGAVHIAPT
ncbi:Os11g0438000 [Oryza sativa Japonica Group]|uniref:Os11g0438000 protein n=2 Tax=Oryza sativa subsp. japonica TaxID=39947 RepID=Q0ISZ5_ORYSJ|nr:hypothetical protein EE612_055234 [Oryza sativa]BAF28170.1 Os11g0438000 [Oryza sativa Japonica Group]BAT13857.1 Os11g0438000 [Oryza sativa Japonica Group]|eukprot:NP_001067807.1 Os11g0438000 [Oryza sativa Japonica Group]